MRTKYHIHLSKENRQELETLIRSGASSARTQTRARILLLTDESQKKNKRTEEIASALMCSVLACSSPPEGRLRWTLQLLADKLVELKLVDSIILINIT